MRELFIGVFLLALSIICIGMGMDERGGRGGVRRAASQYKMQCQCPSPQVQISFPDNSQECCARALFDQCYKTGELCPSKKFPERVFNEKEGQLYCCPSQDIKEQCGPNYYCPQPHSCHPDGYCRM